jgi:hypothetical protein
MCGLSPSEFALLALLVAALAGPRWLARRRPRRPPPGPSRALDGRPEPWRVVLGLGAVLVVGLLAVRFGSRLAPWVARLVRGATW